MTQWQGYKSRGNREWWQFYFASHWQGLLLSLLALAFLLSRSEISYYLFLYSAGFVYVQAFYGDRWNWLRKLLIAPFFSAAAVILVSAFFDLIRIPIGIWCVYLAWLSAGAIAAIIPFSVRISEIREYRSYWFEIGMAVIFLLGLGARLIPVWTEPAPILHDPVAHAADAKGIIVSGHVQTFYSPGLHFNIAMATLTTGVDLARTTLILSQFFNALVALAASIFVMEFSKKRWWALLAAGIFAVGYGPANFYTTAGKNSLVFATGFLFLTWAIFQSELTKGRKILLCNLILLTTVLSHYPAAFMCFLGLGVMFLLAQSKKEFIYSLVFALVVGLLWGALKLPYQVQKLNDSQYVKTVPHESLRQILTLSRFQTEATNYINSLPPKLLAQDMDYRASLVPVALILTIFLGFTDRKYWFFPIAFFVNDLLIALGVVFRYVSHLWIVTSTQIISQYIYSEILIALVMSVLLFDLWEKRGARFAVISAFFVLAVFINSAYSLEQRYQDYQDKYHVIEKSDLEAFAWMNENLDRDAKILVDARIHETPAKITVFAGDSGVWIPVYTDFQTSADYSEGWSTEVYSNTKLYLRLAADPENCTLRYKMLERGFKYYFRGSKPVHAIPMVVTDDGYQLLYSNGSVRIYQILPCGS